jgi:hypothetical protein
LLLLARGISGRGGSGFEVQKYPKFSQLQVKIRRCKNEKKGIDTNYNVDGCASVLVHFSSFNPARFAWGY